MILTAFSFTLTSSYSTILNLNLTSLHNNYTVWGPSARSCITLMDPKQLEDYERAVKSAATYFTQNSSQFSQLDAVLASHRLIIVRPSKQSRQDVTAEFASDHILGLVSCAYVEQEYAVRQIFLKTISEHPWLSASAGHIFESHVLLWLRHAPADLCLHCTPAKESLPLLNIPVCGENMEYFLKVEDLKDADKYQSPKCWVPVAQNLPTMDAIVITDEFVITIQAIISSKHDAKSTGFEKVHICLPSKISARQWCHVFLTNSEKAANSLRVNVLKDLPKKMNIHLYSAFFDTNRWDSILTPGHLEELDQDKVRFIGYIDIHIYW